MSAEAPAVSAPAQPLRFGIFPLEAGSAGAVQGTTAPADPAKALDALGLGTGVGASLLRDRRLARDAQRGPAPSAA